VPQSDSVADRENDCISCHMPKRPVSESAHVTFTDHRILRTPQPQAVVTHGSTTLVRLLPRIFSDDVVRARNLGFAYAQLASSTAQRDFVRLTVESLGPLVSTRVADSELFENLGAAYLAVGEIRRSEEAFRRAAERQPPSASAYYSLGYVLQLQGRSAEAIRAYEIALRLDPEKAEAQGNLAAAYAAAGEKKKATEALQRALTLEPGNLKWRSLLAEWMPPRSPKKSRP
jgi:tetratricopeptide (TPR) repeat protein